MCATVVKSAWDALSRDHDRPPTRACSADFVRLCVPYGERLPGRFALSLWVMVDAMARWSLDIGSDVLRGGTDDWIASLRFTASRDQVEVGIGGFSQTEPPRTVLTVARGDAGVWLDVAAVLLPCWRHFANGPGILVRMGTAPEQFVPLPKKTRISEGADVTLRVRNDAVVDGLPGKKPTAPMAQIAMYWEDVAGGLTWRKEGATPRIDLARITPHVYYPLDDPWCVVQYSAFSADEYVPVTVKRYWSAALGYEPAAARSDTTKQASPAPLQCLAMLRRGLLADVWLRAGEDRPSRRTAPCWPTSARTWRASFAGGRPARLRAPPRQRRGRRGISSSCPAAAARCSARWWPRSTAPRWCTRRRPRTTCSIGGSYLAVCVFPCTASRSGRGWWRSS